MTDVRTRLGIVAPGGGLGVALWLFLSKPLAFGHSQLGSRSKITFTRRALSGAFRQTRLNILQYALRAFAKNRSEIITTCLSRLFKNKSLP
jgi:hypothetical protein